MRSLLLPLLIFSLIASNCYTQTMSINYKTLSEKNQELNYIINALIPQINFGQNALMGVRGIASDINSSLDTAAEGMIKKFKDEVSGMQNNTAMNGTGSSLEITGSASVISGTILSAQMKEFSAVIGMAHPVTLIHSYNYSIIYDSLLLNIADLFRTDSDYLKYISDYCIASLRENAQKNGYTNIDEMITAGASPDLNNFCVWNLTEDSLILIFNPAQAAPYVFGIQTVQIPLSNMTDLINPVGPLSFMFR